MSQVNRPRIRVRPGDMDKIRFRYKHPNPDGETILLNEPLHPQFATILSNYRKHYGEAEGVTLFWKWINAHALDPDKPYSVQHQNIGECVNGLCESWRWAKPYISLYRTDENATYWKVLALTANLSMNDNDYRDLAELQRNASSLSYRPLNFNHDHGMMLDFPASRVDISAYEDESVETIIRIDNSATHPLHGKNINQMISDGDVLNVSIEGKPRYYTEVNGVKAPVGYTLLGLALLEKNVTLPGDPLTYLEPIQQGGNN